MNVELTTEAFGPPTVRPPLDPEIVPAEAALREVFDSLRPLGDATVAELRRFTSQPESEGVPGDETQDLTVGGLVRLQERQVPGPAGAPDITILIARPAVDAKASLPAFYHIHGGGMVCGDPETGLLMVLPYVAEGLAMAVSVDYRLAPEHPAPAQVEDCYAGLVWTAEHAQDLRIDLGRLIIVGGSAGGGLAAGTALMARDRGFPVLSHQVLIAPMLDDRFETHSSRMLEHEGSWNRSDNLYGWTALLGERRGAPGVSPYAAPARATDLGRLPRTYIEVGSAEGFRDECLAYAQRLSEAGVVVDMHMWGGGCHSFDVLAPHAAVSQACVATRDEFIRRELEY